MEAIALALFLLAVIIHYPRNDGPAPIKRRSGGMPVIDVTFNGDEAFEMGVDTGASKTAITKEMAESLNVKQVSTKNFIMASGKVEKFGTGYVDSIEVGGAKAENVEVAIVPGKYASGLLGQDVFGDYEINIKRDQVEFNRES